MVQNNGITAKTLFKTTPNLAPNPNKLSQQCLEAFTSPNNIVLIDANTFSFGLMDFGLVGFGLMGAPYPNRLLRKNAKY